MGRPSCFGLGLLLFCSLGRLLAACVPLAPNLQSDLITFRLQRPAAADFDRELIERWH
jgi:hypothetical protein